MKSEFEWVSMFLFCPMDSWNILLNEGIQTFLQKTDKEIIKRYRIELNYGHGDNVRFSVLIAGENKNILYKIMQEYFRDILASIPNSNLETRAIQSDLNNLDYDEELLNSKYLIQQEMSKLIIDFSKDKSPDIMTIFILAFSLHISIYTGLKKMYCGNERELSKIYFTEDHLSNSNVEAKGNEKENDDHIIYFFLTVASEFLNENSDESDARGVWSNKLVKLCENHFFKSLGKAELSYDDIMSIRNVQTDLFTLINIHLGTTYDLKYFVAKVFPKLYSENSIDIKRHTNQNRNDHILKVNKTNNICKKIDLGNNNCAGKRRAVMGHTYNLLKRKCKALIYSWQAF